MADVRYRFVATGANEVQAAFAGITAAAQKSAGQVRQSHQGTATAARKAAGDSLSARERAEQKWATAAEKASQKAANAAQRAEAKRWAEVERTGRKIQQEFAKEAAAAERAANRRATAEERANARIRAERVRNVGRVVGNAAMYGGMAAAGLIAMAGRGALQLGDTATRLSINAGLAGEKVDATQARNGFIATALAAPGLKAQDIGEAALAFQSKTGKALDSRTLGMMGTVAQGTGADIQDIASASAGLSTKLGVKGLEDMREALSAIAVQGAQGAFELKDAAALFDRLTAAAGRFNVKGVEGAKTLGGLTQLAMEGTGDPEQAATAVENVFKALSQNAVKLQGEGVNVFKDKGMTQARDVKDVLMETIAAKKGNMPALEQLFDVRGMRGVSTLVQTYNEAVASGADGMQAMRAKLDGLIATTDAVAKVEEAAAQAQNTTSARVTAAWEKVQAVAADRLIPALLPAIERLPELADALTPIIDVASDLVGALTDFLNILPGAEKRNKERKQRELDKVQDQIARSGVPTAEMVAKRDALLAEIGPAEAAAEPQLVTDATRRKGVGVSAAIGGVAGATVGNPLLGAAAGAAFGEVNAAAAQQQASEYMAQRSQGYLETSSGGALHIEQANMARKGVAAAAGAIDPKATEAALQRLAMAADIAAPALRKIAESGQASIVP